MRAIGVQVNAETTAGGFILPNDRVDVVLSRDVSGGNGSKNFESETILSDVRVLAVDQTAQPQKDQQSVVGKTATLELAPAQAELLARSQQMGIVSLVLRALGDSTGEPVAEIPKKRATAPVIFATHAPEKNNVVVFRYGRRREAEDGPGGAASPAPAAAPAAASSSAPAATTGITNPVSIVVAPSPIAMTAQ